jgi:hypothetical protein
MDKDIDPPETVEGDAPEVCEVIQLYQKTLNDFSSYESLQNRNWDTRHCLWPGKSNDNRKHAAPGESTKPFPWEGASDIPVPIVDETIGFLVALDVTSFSRANIRATANREQSLDKSAVVSNFMKWLMNTQISERRAECELISQLRRERGLGFMRVGWEKLEQKVLVPMKLTDFQKNPEAAPIGEAIMNPSMDEATSDWMKVMGEKQGQKVTKKQARRMVKELRETGETTASVVVGVVNRPKFKALAPGEDIFFPASTPLDIQEASAIFERVWLTPAASRMKIKTEKWDDAYTTYVADRCAKSNHHGDLVDSDHRYQTTRVAGGRGPDLREGLCEWIYAYQKLTDEDGNVGLYRTIFCPDASDEHSEGYAKHGLFEHRNGKYPYVPFQNETLSRCILDARGVPETTGGWQDAIKVEVDGRIDGASMSTVPPRYHPPGREPTEWGPGTSVVARRADEYGYIGSAANPGNSIEVQNTLQKIVRSFNGRPTDELDMNEAMTKQRKSVEDFLTCWQKVAEMVWELYQQYGPDEEFFRVVGVPQEKAQRFNKSEYSGKYDFQITYDVLNNDPEQQLTRLEKMGQIAQQADRSGAFNWTKYLQLVMNANDPTMAEDLLIPDETAQQKEVDGTYKDITQMWSGIDTDPPMNANVDLRLGIMKQWIEGTSPQTQPTDVQERMKTDKALQTRFGNYTKKLEFQKQQYQVNPEIGRTGGKPAYSQ